MGSQRLRNRTAEGLKPYRVRLLVSELEQVGLELKGTAVLFYINPFICRTKPSIATLVWSAVERSLREASFFSSSSSPIITA